MDSPPRDDSATDDLGSGARDDPSSTDDASTDNSGPSSATYDDPLDDVLPHADVDSRWWYWIAAIPLYVVLGTVFGVVFAAATLIGVGLDGGVLVLPVLFVFGFGFGLAGLVLTLLFPVATYVDARAIADAEASWTPDPLVWGLAALATAILSAFTLSFVLALYYLYKRHVAVGTP